MAVERQELPIDPSPLPARLPFMTRNRRRAYNEALLQKAVKVAVEPWHLEHLPERDRPLIEEAAKAIQRASTPTLPALGSRAVSQTRGSLRPINARELAQNAALALRPSASVTPAEIEVELLRQGLDWTQPFAPGAPLKPYYGYDRRPRQYDYVTGRNITTDTRPDRMPFPVLKQVVENYDMASICIRHIVNDLRSMKLEFGPMQDYEGDVAREIVEAKRFLRRPDGKHLFTTWLARYMLDVLRFDAGCLWKERNRAGKLIALKTVSGSTIAPIVDYFGDRPAPPAPAYQQFIQGIPWDWLSEEDVIYEPQWPITESPYGVAPIETCLINANTDVRLQMFFLGFFTDGVVPEMLLVAPENLTDPDSIAEIQETWDAWYESNQTGRHGGRWVPGGTKPFPYKPTVLDPTLAEYVMRRTVAAFGLVPQDLGFTETVNRATADTQVDTQFRITTLPNTEYYEAILDAVLQEDLQLPVAVHFDTGREKEDRLMEAQAQYQYWQMGAVSSDEVRARILGLPVDNKNPVPRIVFDNRIGPIPLAWLESVSGKVDPVTLSPSTPPPQVPFFPLVGQREQTNVEEKGPDASAQPLPQHVNPALGRPKNPDQGDIHSGIERHGQDRASGRPSASPSRRAAVKAIGGITSSVGLAGADLEDGRLEDDEENRVEEYTGEVRKELLRWRDNSRARLARKQLPKYFASSILPPAVRDQIWLLIQSADRQTLDEVFARALDGTRAFKSHRVPQASGLALRALDTGRLLLIQRAMDNPDDPNRGLWEFPGGHSHPNETSEQGARREWEEEVGVRLPASVEVCSTWNAPNGRYIGHFGTIPRESDLTLNGREEVPNPDGDTFEAVGWFDLEDLPKLPNLRPELAGDIGQVQEACRLDVRQLPAVTRV